MKSYAYSAAILLSVNLLGCSGSSEREPGGLDELIPDSGPSGQKPDGGTAAEDAGDLDASDDVLVPNDADRSDWGGECTKDEHCAARIEAGACERAACDLGKCIKAHLPNGTACDDANACTTGDACKEGRCQGGDYDPAAIGCVQDPSPGALWFSEIMGNPVAVPGSVDPVEGQWFELGSVKPIRLNGLKLVYFEWDGPTAPVNPASPTVFSLSPGETDRGSYTVFLRSQDINKNGWGKSQWSYSEISFSKTRHAILMIVMPNWGGAFPVPESQIVAKIQIPGGTFGDANAGKAWQLSASTEDPGDGQWCYAESAYDPMMKNHGSPRSMNADCN